ncbi:hypothetical protein D3C72_2556810 [compost metagenome]
MYEGANKYGVESYNHLISNYSQLNELLINEFQSVQNGDQKVEAALPGIQEKITKLLERLNK